MKTLPQKHRRAPARNSAAYLMTEALVYIGAVVVLMGVGYAAVYRCIDHSMVLRRNAADISRTLDAGEQWRADIRSPGAQARYVETDEGQVLRLKQGRGQVDYRLTGNTLSRRRNDEQWVVLLDRVKSSEMRPDPRENVPAWRWELELLSRAKGSAPAGRIRPLFTFIAVPQPVSTP